MRETGSSWGGLGTPAAISLSDSERGNEHKRGPRKMWLDFREKNSTVDDKEYEEKPSSI